MPEPKYESHLKSCLVDLADSICMVAASESREVTDSEAEILHWLTFYAGRPIDELREEVRCFGI